MRKRLHVVTVMCLLALGALSAAATAIAAGPERYLHVKVEDGEKGESVNVNVPLSMAEKILPSISNGDLHQGRVTLHNSEINGVDIRTILDALRNAADNEFVTVKENGMDKVRVAKSGGNIVIHVRDREGKEEGKEQKVDVTVPMKVVDALFATAKDDELDIVSALRALSDAGDILLVTVQDAQQKVRVWVDSRSTAE